MGKITLNFTGSLPICWHRASSPYIIPLERFWGPPLVYHTCIHKLALYKVLPDTLPITVAPPLGTSIHTVLPTEHQSLLWCWLLSWSRGILGSQILLVLCLIKQKSVEHCLYLLFYKPLRKQVLQCFFMALRPGPWDQAHLPHLWSFPNKLSPCNSSQKPGMLSLMSPDKSRSQ